jgi:cyclopropane fatty-acyl-phospholipid synthase-like methyltransferase
MSEKTNVEWGQLWDAFWVDFIKEFGHTLRKLGTDKLIGYDPALIQDKVVFEMGCGIGILAGQIVPLAKKYYAMDISPFAVKTCTEKCEGKATVYLAQMEEDYKKIESDLKFSVDTVLSRHVFIHLGEEKVMKHLALARSVLKPGGTLVTNFFRPSIIKTYAEKNVDQTAGGVVYYPVETIEHMLIERGFHIVSLKETPERYEVVAK